MSWGEAIGKVFSWIPTKREHERNRIADIEREMDELQEQGLNGKRADRYVDLAIKLRKLRQKAKNT